MMMMMIVVLGAGGGRDLGGVPGRRVRRAWAERKAAMIVGWPFQCPGTATEIHALI
jgi:hypothetical protein